MTPFVGIVDGAQVEIVFFLDGQPIENRLWFVNRQPPTDLLQLQSLADGVFEWHASEVMPHLASELSLAVVEAKQWETVGDPVVITTSAAVAGGNTGGCHSANVADRIWFYSAFAGGRIRNSNFVPGVPLDKVNLNTPDATWRLAIRNAYVDLIDLASGFGPFPAWRWVCASAWLDGSLRVMQHTLRTDFIRYLRPWVAQRRKRLPV